MEVRYKICNQQVLWWFWVIVFYDQRGLVVGRVFKMATPVEQILAMVNKANATVPGYVVLTPDDVSIVAMANGTSSIPAVNDSKSGAE